MGDLQGMCVISVKGQLDEDGVKRLRRQMIDAIALGEVDIIVDLGQCTFMSHTAIGLLVERARQCRAQRGDVRLCCLSEYVKRVMRMAGVTRILRAFDTREDAIQSVLSARRMDTLAHELGNTMPNRTAQG